MNRLLTSLLQKNSMRNVNVYPIQRIKTEEAWSRYEILTANIANYKEVKDIRSEKQTFVSRSSS